MGAKNIEVEPDGFAAAARVAAWQGDHADSIKGYIGGTCNHTDAFTGVLMFFRGMYSHVVSDATEGMDSNKQVAEKVETAMKAAQKTFLQADREVYDAAQKLMSDLGLPPLPAYHPTGSGDDTPTHGVPTTPGEKGEPDERVKSFMEGWEKSNERGEKFSEPLFGKDDDAKPWQVKQRALDWITEKAHDRVTDFSDPAVRAGLRHAGLTDSDINQVLQHSRDHGAASIAHSAIADRRDGAYGSAYMQYAHDHPDSTEAERHSHAMEAYRTQSSSDYAEARHRSEQFKTAGEAKELYDTTAGIVTDGYSTYENIEHANEADEASAEMDKYASEPEDHDNQDWAKS